MRTSPLLLPLARLFALAAVSLPIPAQSTPPSVELISTPDDPLVLGTQPIEDAGSCQLSRDGRIVLFVSAAWNLVPGDRNRQRDIFVRDRVSGELQRVLGNGGAELIGNPLDARLSGDGRWVAFVTSESLVVGDTNNASDVYLWHQVDGAIELISRSATGAAIGGRLPDLTVDARYVAFSSSANEIGAGGVSQVFRLDRDTGSLVLASVDSAGVVGNGTSERARLIVNRYVAFESSASNLVVGDSNGVRDVFVRDLVTSTTRRVSVDTSGVQLAQASAIIGAGLATVPLVQFSTSAVVVPGDSNGITDLFRIRLDNGSIVHTSPRVGGGFRTNGTLSTAATTADGGRALWSASDGDWDPSDTNGVTDVFAASGANSARRLSATASGEQGNGSSATPCGDADGTSIGFATHADNLVAGDDNGVQDVLICDGSPCVLERVSLAESAVPISVDRESSNAPDLSADGRYAVFAAEGSLLAPGAPDVLLLPDVVLRDRSTGDNVLITPGDATGDDAVVSDDGRYVAFVSIYLPPLYTTSGPGLAQAFLYDRMSGTTTLISKSSVGAPGTARVGSVAISGDGSTVVFDTAASNLADGDINNDSDVFVYDVASGALTRIVPNVSAAGGGKAPRVSRNGRRIVFDSDDSDYVSGDGNGSDDVFGFDRDTQVFRRLSTTASDEPNDASFEPDISADGNRVIFTSSATNFSLPIGNWSGERLYRVAWSGGAVESVGGRPDNTPLAATDYLYGGRLSHDGSVVVHFGDFAGVVAPGTSTPAFIGGLVMRSTGAGATQVIGVAPSGTWVPDVSDRRAIAVDASGNIVAFATNSGDFLPDLDHNGEDDVYLLTRTEPVDALYANGFE